MLPTVFHGYNPVGPERVALVRCEPSLDRVQYLIRILRGPRKKALYQTDLLGPYPEEEIAERFQAALQKLREDGFQEGGIHALLAALDDDRAGVRARAALRLGWRRCREGVEPLLALLERDSALAGSLLDALGAIGDERAIPAIRPWVEQKQLFLRRSAVEALRLLGDEDGLARARTLALERLPEEVRLVLQQQTLQLSTLASHLLKAVHNLKLPPLGTTLDTLYELGSPATVSVVRQVLQNIPFNQAYVWRAVKSIFKRAELRHDYVTLGWLIHAIETQSRSRPGVINLVRSGLDGIERPTSIFGRKTRQHLQRRTWRYLVDLARYRPERFTAAAAEVLIHYHGVGHPGSYLAWRLLGRWLAEEKKLPSAGVRWERFASLWDAEPRPLLHLLSAARSAAVQRFALHTLRGRHPLLIRSARHSEILAMLQAPYEPTVELALQELERRFDTTRPDWQLLRQMLEDPRPTARTLGQRWLRLTAAQWLPDVDRIIDFLGIQHSNLRAIVAEMVVDYLHDQPDLRRRLTERIVLILRLPDSAAGIQAGYAIVAREALGEEIRQLVPVQELAGWIVKSAPVVKEVAGHLLRQRPEAVVELGLERLSLLAQHEVASVRAAGLLLIRSAVGLLREDPSILYVLVESEWDDTRAAALELLRQRIDAATLGLEGVIGLLDSTRPEVQKLGKELALNHLDQLPSGDLVLRLVQHPDPALRRFALELAIQHLPAGVHSLVQLKGFCRSALFDTWPQRQVKDLALALLTERGLEDREQAEVAVAILGDVIRSQTRADFERALQALVRLQIAWPDLPSTVRLVTEPS